MIISLGPMQRDALQVYVVERAEQDPPAGDGEEVGLRLLADSISADGRNLCLDDDPAVLTSAWAGLTNAANSADHDRFREAREALDRLREQVLRRLAKKNPEHPPVPTAVRGAMVRYAHQQSVEECESVRSMKPRWRSGMLKGIDWARDRVLERAWPYGQFADTKRHVEMLAQHSDPRPLRFVIEGYSHVPPEEVAARHFSHIAKQKAAGYPDAFWEGVAMYCKHLNVEAAEARLTDGGYTQEARGELWRVAGMAP